MMARNDIGTGRVLITKRAAFCLKYLISNVDIVILIISARHSLEANIKISAIWSLTVRLNCLSKECFNTAQLFKRLSFFF